MFATEEAAAALLLHGWLLLFVSDDTLLAL
jgi:hypothetical protein